MWKIGAYPKGDFKEQAGSFDVFVKLVTMPSSWKHIEICHRFQCNETKASSTGYDRYERGSSFGWLLPPEIQGLETLSFTVSIFINKIVLREHDKVFFERAITAKPQRIRWAVGHGLLRSIKSAHEGKYFESEIFGGAWCLILKRMSSHFVVHLTSCALPKGTDKITVMHDTECILKGQGIDKKVTNSFTDDFEVGGGSKGCIWDQNDLPLDDIKKCDSLEIAVDIIPDPDSKALDHWGKVAEQIADDEKGNEPGAAIKKSVHDQYEKRLVLVETRIESVVLTLDSVTSKLGQLSSQIAEMREDITALKEAQRNMGGDEESKEQSEEEKLRKWLESEVKLPQYFQVLNDNGFDDLEGALELTEQDLREMGIDKMGHRRKIMKKVQELKAGRNRMIRPQQQHDPMPVA